MGEVVRNQKNKTSNPYEMKTMLKEICGLDKVIESGLQFADWVWSKYDKPGNEKDYNMEEAIAERDANYAILKEAGVENAVWNLSKDCGGRTYTCLLIRFAKMTDMSFKLLQMDMNNDLIPVNPATSLEDGEAEYVCHNDEFNEDIYCCPFNLKYEDGWLELKLKIFRD